MCSQACCEVSLIIASSSSDFKRCASTKCFDYPSQDSCLQTEKKLNKSLKLVRFWGLLTSRNNLPRRTCVVWWNFESALPDLVIFLIYISVKLLFSTGQFSTCGAWLEADFDYRKVHKTNNLWSLQKLNTNINKTRVRCATTTSFSY